MRHKFLLEFCLVLTPSSYVSSSNRLRFRLFVKYSKSATLSDSTFYWKKGEAMAIHYPTEREELQFEIERLWKRNEELVIDVMRQSARASEAEETLKRWRTELEIVAEQKGHNLCWIWIPSLLKATIGHTGKYPDPQKVTRAEFEFGCKVYQDDIFGPKIDIPKQLENQGMLTEEQAKLLREKLGFKE